MTPHSPSYGTEAIIPLEVDISTKNTTLVEGGGNHDVLKIKLDLAKGKRVRALVKLAAKQEHTKSYNRKIQPRESALL